jgi:hypothetical protein
MFYCKLRSVQSSRWDWFFPHDSRHFVPGYYRAVPPGRKPFASRSASQLSGCSQLGVGNWILLVHEPIPARLRYSSHVGLDRKRFIRCGADHPESWLAALDILLDELSREWFGSVAARYRRSAVAPFRATVKAFRDDQGFRAQFEE